MSMPESLRRIHERRFELTGIVVGLAAITVALLALYLQWTSQPYRPLSNVRLEFLVAEGATLDPVPARLSGCASEDTTVLIFSFWRSGPRAHLGPSLSVPVEEGCYDNDFTLTVPPVEAGEWQLSIVVLATGERGTQTLPTSTPPIKVLPR